MTLRFSFYEIMSVLVLVSGLYSRGQAQSNPLRPPQVVVISLLPERANLEAFLFRGPTPEGFSDWPTLDARGFWRGSPSLIKISGTAKLAASIDSSFYAAQSDGTEDLLHREVYRRQMRDSYLDLFENHYYGSRVPLFFVHHEAPLQGGAYRDALRDFIGKACGLPEVKCMGPEAFQQWMAALPPSLLESYRAGAFEPLSRQAPPTTDRPLDVRLALFENGEELGIVATGADFDPHSMRLKVTLNGQKVSQKRLSWVSLRQRFPPHASLSISGSILDKRGVEIQRASWRISSPLEEN